MDPSENLPLFPLDMVLLPHRRVPLHIFEERYKLLVDECVNNESEFGMVWGSDDGFCDIGCAARVIQVINRLPDGRMNILIEGTRRFRILERQDFNPYMTGTVEEVKDEDEPFNLDLGNRVRNLYAEAVKLSLGWAASQPPVIQLGHLSFVVSAGLNLPNEDLQALLENTSVNSRLKFAAETLQKALENLRETKRRLGGNGHLA